MPGHQVMWTDTLGRGINNGTSPANLGPAGATAKGPLGGLAPPFPAAPAIVLSHQQLLHQGYHLVPHHNPHPHHNYETLILILTAVHVAAIFYFLWLFTRPPTYKQRPRTRAPHANCEYNYPNKAVVSPLRPGPSSTARPGFTVIRP